LCNRKFGIGSDGLIIIKEHIVADFEMQFYNPDGSMSFCGNGSRCAVLFCFHNGLCRNKSTFFTNDGFHTGEIMDNENIRINIICPIKVNKFENGDFQTNTGSPHYIRFVNDLVNINFLEESKIIRYNDKYKEEGINVNMVLDREREIEMRTYERGVENETLSCGSGVTAAALSFALLKKKRKIN
jgi:diaminopimelate epimerase